MTETTTRIRWTAVNGTVMSWAGYVGTLKAPPFQILHPVACDAGRHRFDEWVLCCTFLGEDGVPRYGGADPGAPGRLKAEAERWLAEFAASLGAVFPGEPGEPAAFQVSEARDTLALWDRNQAGEPVTSRERVLADQVRNLLAIVALLTIPAGEEAGDEHTLPADRP